jgi:Domain of unknown function (DUF3601)
MSFAKRKFTAADLVYGQTYTVVKMFLDYDGIIHSIGERWRFVEKDFLPYEDGLTLHIEWNGERNGQSDTLRLQWRTETQAQIIDDFSDYVEETGI